MVFSTHIKALTLSLTFCFFAFKSQAQKVDLILPLGHQQAVNKAIFSPDHKLVYTASNDQTISIWDAVSGQELRKLRGPMGPVLDLAVSANGRYVASGCNDGIAMLWNPATGKMLKLMPHHFIPVQIIRFSPLTNFLTTVGVERNPLKSNLYFWNLPGANLDRTIEWPNEEILDIGLSLDLKAIFAITKQGILHRIDGVTMEETKVDLHQYFTLAAFSPSGNFLWVQSQGKILSYHSGDTIPYAQFEPLPVKGITALCGDSTGKTVMIGYENGCVGVKLAGSPLVIYPIHSQPIRSMQCAPDGSTFLTASADHSAILGLSSSGLVLRKLEGQSIAIHDFSLLPSENKILSLLADSSLKEWKIGDRVSLDQYANLEIDQTQLSTDSLHHQIATTGQGEGRLLSGITKRTLGVIKEKSEVKKLEISPDGQWMALLMDHGEVKISKDSGQTFMVPAGNFPNSLFTNIQFGMHHQLLMSGTHTLVIWDLDQQKAILDKGILIYPILKTGHNPDLSFIAVATGKDSITIYKTSQSKAPLFTLELHRYMDISEHAPDIQISADGKYLAVAMNDHQIALADLSAKKITHLYYGHTDQITALAFTADGKHLMSSGMDHTIRLWDLEFHEEEALMVTDVSATDYSYTNTMITKYDPDAIIAFKAASQQEQASFITLKQNDWIITTPDRYYFCNKGAAKALGYNKNGKHFSFEQFDLKYNRPDLVLKRIGIKDTDLIEAYHKAYLKRLRKLGFTEEQLNDEFNLPTLRIQNFEYLPTVTDSEDVNFDLDLKDEKFPLDRLNCWANGIAVFGSNGINLKDTLAKRRQVHVRVKLTPGSNHIRFTTINGAGVESYATTATIDYRPKQKVKGTLYLMALSVSTYADASMNLRYAAKDGRDLVKTLAESKDFQKVVVDTFFNQRANKLAIQAMKTKLKQTGVNDMVILFVSGHGMLDANLDFYFATYDMDFKHPETKGIPYEALEDLLDSIPARRKLLLMDACHSGELDREEKITITGLTPTPKPMENGIAAVSARSSQLLESDSRIGLENSFEMMQELFAGINKGSGTVVISAAAGMGYAFESDTWNNGVFTYSMLKGIQSHDADRNHDGIITAREMMEYVSGEVERLTHGAQKPTSRRENIEFDWTIWMY